jgi:protein TonB
MARDIDLTSREWLDLVFEGKNREYGAYELREDSSNRHIKALVIVTIVGLAFIFLPRIVKTVVPQQQVAVAQYGVVEITDIEKTSPAKTEEEVKVITPPAMEVKKAIQFTLPKIVIDSEVRNELTTQLDLSDKTAVISVTTVLEGVTVGGIDPAEFHEVTQTPAVKPAGPTIIDCPEVPAAFPGGEKELMKWLSENLVYPAIAIDNGIEGRVILRFVVAPDGSVSNVEIQRSLDPSCDKEAVRVIKKMPKWVPGRHNGNTVYAYFTLPILFKLQK